MHISYSTNLGNLNTNTGYGAAGFGVVTSLQALGHRVTFKDPTAPVEIAFCMPDFSEWSSPNAYHIQYTPWESTKLKPGWLEAFNENCDEVWTTSPLVKEWYEAEGVVKPLYVYEHGIDPDYTQRRRRRGDKLRFLHIGEPAVRKGGQMAFDSFRNVFGDRDDVSLTIKAWNNSNIRIYKKGNHIIGNPDLLGNVNVIKEDFNRAAMVFLMHSHDVLVYPSWGEGFGFIPLEALATGMPVISPSAWAPYSRYLLPELALESTLVDSPWPNEHPGQMFQPTVEGLENAMVDAESDFNRLAGLAYRNSFAVHKDYDWQNVTKVAWERIEKKFDALAE